MREKWELLFSENMSLYRYDARPPWRTQYPATPLECNDNLGWKQRAMKKRWAERKGKKTA